MAILLTNGDDSYITTATSDTDIDALDGNDIVSVTTADDVKLRLYGGSGMDALTVLGAGQLVHAELYGGMAMIA